MRIVLGEGFDQRKAAIAGVSFWVGVGFQNQVIFPDVIGEGFMGVLLGNGMTSGAIVAVLLAAFAELTGSRRRSLRVAMDDRALPQVMDFMREFATRHKWDDRRRQPAGRRRRRDARHLGALQRGGRRRAPSPCLYPPGWKRARQS